MYARPSHLAKTTRVCCSMECSIELRRQYMRGENNHQYGLKGEKNSSYLGRKSIQRNGYVLKRIENHPFAQDGVWVLEHRLIAEKYLLDENNSVEINGKRYLRPDLIVHHKDLNKKNNIVENLEIMTLDEHTRIHNLINPMPRDNITGQFLKKKKHKDVG